MYHRAMFDKLKGLVNTPRRALAVAAALFLANAAADHVSTKDVSFAPFYLLPVTLVAWRLGLRWGLGTALAAAATWLAEDFLIPGRVYAHPGIPYWNALIELFTFAGAALLVTKLRQLLERAKAESALKSGMIHAVSHEFNNALTSVNTALYLLREMDTSGDELRQRLYSSMTSAQNKLKLYVKNILNEARMEEGKFKLQKQPLLLRELVAEAAESVEELVRQKKIRLEVLLPEQPLAVDADKEAMALVISNLLGNAVKYTPSGGAITAQIAVAGARGERVLFSVEDTGPGISLDDLKKITSGFYRTVEGKVAAEGFGLGLKISNDLLALHGSRLQIASERGRGSNFFFELDLLRAGPPAQDGGK